MNLQRIIKAVCKKRKVSAARIGRDLGMSRQAFNWHCTKEIDITLELIDKMSKKYDIDPVTLFSYLYKPMPKIRVVRKTYRPPSFD